MRFVTTSNVPILNVVATSIILGFGGLTRSMPKEINFLVSHRPHIEGKCIDWAYSSRDWQQSKLEHFIIGKE